MPLVHSFIEQLRHKIMLTNSLLSKKWTGYQSKIVLVTRYFSWQLYSGKHDLALLSYFGGEGSEGQGSRDLFMSEATAHSSNLLGTLCTRFFSEGN